jgi:ADP-ribose pyrophosphatase YjhB (NUDIX family)
MQRLVPPALHRLLYRIAYRVRRGFRRAFRLPIYGVNAVLRDAQGRVLLVRHSYGPPHWTLPGSGHGRREDPAQAVRRELREELGIEIGELEHLQTYEEVLSGAPHRSNLFGGLALGEPRPDGREVIAARFFAADDLPESLPASVQSRLDLLFAVERDRGIHSSGN